MYIIGEATPTTQLRFFERTVIVRDAYTDVMVIKQDAIAKTERVLQQGFKINQENGTTSFEWRDVPLERDA